MDVEALAAQALPVLFNQTLSVVRAGTGTYVDGVWTETPETTVQVRASVQPISARELAREPEGTRPTGAIRLFTLEELRTADIDQPEDRFVYRGKTWFVDRSMYHPGGHYESRAVLQDQGGV